MSINQLSIAKGFIIWTYFILMLLFKWCIKLNMWVWRFIIIIIQGNNASHGHFYDLRSIVMILRKGKGLGTAFQDFMYFQDSMFSVSWSVYCLFWCCEFSTGSPVCSIHHKIPVDYMIILKKNLKLFLF